MAIKPLKKSKGIVSWPETERPREKLLHSGSESLSDGELLAVLVRIGKKGDPASHGCGGTYRLGYPAYP